MDNQQAIKTALDRRVDAIAAQPSLGQGTAVTRVTLRPGLACDVEEGGWKFSVGMPDRFGGSNEGPNPGVYGRAAFGSCLAIGYSMWAARLGVPLNALEVEVHADYDARGELAVDDSVRPGYLAMRYVVTVDSDASEEDVMRLLDTAERYSSWLDDLVNPVPVTREVRIAARRRG